MLLCGTQRAEPLTVAKLTNVIGEIYAASWAFRNLLKDGTNLQRVNNVSRVIWSLLSYVKTCSYLRANFEHWSMRTLPIMKCVFILFGDLFYLQKMLLLNRNWGTTRSAWWKWCGWQKCRFPYLKKHINTPRNKQICQVLI